MPDATYAIVITSLLAGIAELWRRLLNSEKESRGWERQFITNNVNLQWMANEELKRRGELPIEIMKAMKEEHSSPVTQLEARTARLWNGKRLMDEVARRLEIPDMSDTVEELLK